jgi:hypothetical protein
VQLPVLLKYQLIVSQIKFIICYCNINCFSNKEILLYSEDINCITDQIYCLLLQHIICFSTKVLLYSEDII